MANSLSASTPQWWANEALDTLFETAVAVGQVNRQFSNRVSSAGNQVNAYRAPQRTTRRKTKDDAYSAGDATLTAVPVVLDQYFYDSFVIKDEEKALSLPEQKELHMVPAMQSITRGLERAILGRVHSFLRSGTPAKRAGKLGGMTSTNSKDYVLEAEEVLFDNLAPEDQLYSAIVHQTVNTLLMNTELFQRADARGTNPSVQTGEVGEIFNTRVFKSQNVNYVNAALADTQTAAINNTGGYAAGTATALTVTDPGTDWTAGEYVVIAGNQQPNFVASTASATSITLDEALKYAVVDTAVITHYLKCVNEATQRDAGYQKSMTFTHTSGKNLQKGQLISFGTGGSRHTYTIIEVSATTATTTTVLLDRPLEATVASGANAFPGPGGAMCPVMHRDAIALVTRPMDNIPAEEGARSAVASYDGVGVRVVMQYDSSAGGTRVNVDLLAGISVLDEDLLCVMLA